MGKLYVRTIISSPHEIPFIEMNIIESKDYVDKFIVSESNFTHRGEYCGHRFGETIRDFEKKHGSHIQYAALDLSDTFREYNNKGENLHWNEQKIRNGFTKHVELNGKENIISLDADEVLYRSKYKLFAKMTKFKMIKNPIGLQLMQMFYKLNYHWTNCKFTSPIISPASKYLFEDNAQWRDVKNFTPFYAGVHFSWVMSIDDMLSKLHKYAHTDLYGHLANRETLERAVKEKKYIFDNTVKFTLEKLDPKSNKLPKSLLDVFNLKSDLFA